MKGKNTLFCNIKYVKIFHYHAYSIVVIAIFATVNATAFASA